MLEDRLSSAYSQHTLGYGPIPGGAQYPNVYPSMPTNTAEVKPGAENFYYGNSSVEQPGPARTPYPQPHLDRGIVPTRSIQTHPQQPTSGPYWSRDPQAIAPSQSNHTHAYPHSAGYPASGAPSQYYSSPAYQEPENHFQQPGQGEVESPYAPSPVTRRDSYYQTPTGFAQNPTEQPPPVEHGQPSGYMQPADPRPLQSGQAQQREPPAQSYYLPQQQQQPQPAPGAGYQGYPQRNISYQAPYGGDVSPISQPPPVQYQQPVASRPAAEESLIEL